MAPATGIAREDALIDRFWRATFRVAPRSTFVLRRKHTV